MFLGLFIFVVLRVIGVFHFIIGTKEKDAFWEQRPSLPGYFDD
jgi:hypothetical protein